MNKKTTLSQHALFHDAISTPFGLMIIAQSECALAYAAFADNLDAGFLDLQKEFPHTTLEQKRSDFHGALQAIFAGNMDALKNIALHMAGTDFQQRVWAAAQAVPLGVCVSYQTLAQHIGQPQAARAVGQALGRNRLAFLIACHRIIPSGGDNVGQYRWGAERKKAILDWEKTLAQR